MKKNMGNIDRIARIILALVFAGLYLMDMVTGTVGVVLLGLGGVFLLTSVVSFCPLYTIFGMTTCKTSE
jgi:hypothetical protein